MTGCPTRPVLRYHGGKFRLRRWILDHFPPHRIYVEPYGGAGSVLLAKPRSFAEVYNDLDGDMVNVFRVLRDPDHAAALRRLLELTPFSRAEFRAAYQPTEDPVERARRTIIRGFMSFGTTSRRSNRTGFRGRAYRQNQTGAMDWAGYPPQIPAFVDRLRGVTIEERDALEVIAQQDTAETLFYCDPPYVHETRTSLQWESANDRAYAVDMTDDDHRALLDRLCSIDGMAIVSGYPTALYDAALADWHRVETTTLADGAKPRTEVLWINPPAWLARERVRLPLSAHWEVAAE